MAEIKNIDDLLNKLEADVPDVYIKCVASFPDKKGNEKEKKCILNLKTGDVFKDRALKWDEVFNHRVIRFYGDENHPMIAYFSYQNAQVVDDKIVLTTWVFGDYVNQPGTANLEFSWYGGTNIDGLPKRDTPRHKALASLFLSQPKIASVVTVSKNRVVERWDDLERYGYLTKTGDMPRNEYLSRSLSDALYSSYDAKRIVGLLECAKKLFEIGYIGANKYVIFDSHKELALFMKESPMQIKSNKNQQKIDELSSILLPNHSTSTIIDKVVCYADRVNSEWTVLRWLMQVAPTKFVETSRLYVNKTEALHCRSDLNGNWIYAAAKLKAETFNADRVILQYPCVLDGTKLEYFKNISADMSNQSASLYMLTMYPEFEKMYKIGLDWLCDAYLKSTWQHSWKNYLEETIGLVDWSAKNIMKMIGVNRHQIEKINEWRKKVIPKAQNSHYVYWSKRSVDSIIGKLRRVFGTTPMSDIDNETFDYIIDSITYSRLMGMYITALQKTFEVYPKDAMYFIRDLNAVGPTDSWTVTTVTAYGHTSQMNIDRLYFDTLQMIDLGAYMDRIRPRFSTTDELVGHHQILIDLMNVDKAEHDARANARYESGFNAHHKRWEKWEWEGNDEFCIIAPSKPVDVAVEGITLRHCVKSYIPSVSAGTTNILFIRRKGHEDVPFFTVEVDSRNQIRQVHGMCNCNVTSVDGLLEFVTKWSKLKKLRYNETFANGMRVAR